MLFFGSCSYFHGSMHYLAYEESILPWKYAPYRYSSYILRRPLRFDGIPKFYLKLFSSVKKKLEISSYFFGPLKIYELQKNTYVHCTYYTAYEKRVYVLPWK